MHIKIRSKQIRAFRAIVLNYTFDAVSFNLIPSKNSPKILVSFEPEMNLKVF